MPEEASCLLQPQSVAIVDDDALVCGSVATLRWTRKFGQGIKLGLLLRRTDANDGQAEAVFGGF